MMRVPAAFLGGIACALALAGAGTAQARTLTLADAVRIATDQNPDLRAAMLDARAAAATVSAEEDLYPFLVTADTGYTRRTPATLRLGGGVGLATSDAFLMTAGLHKAFATGTRLSLELTGSVDRQSAEAEGGGTAVSGPGFGIAGRFTVSQPLLRGFGTRVGEASLRQARIQRTAAERAADRVRSAMVRDVLGAWWELWYATAAVEIQREARDLAARQLEEVRTRVKRGTVAPVETLQFETTLATREEELVAAESGRLQQSLELARLLAVDGAEAGTLQSEGPAPGIGDAGADAATIVARAREAAPEILEREAGVDLARDRALVAGEESRPRLDVQAWIQGEGLADRAVAPAFQQIGRAEAGGAFVGLTFESPLSTQRLRSERAAAEMAAQSSAAGLESVVRQIEAQAASLVSQRATARTRVTLAERTLDAAERLVAAERQRYQVGTAIALQVQEAEDAVRRARLRLTRARVDRVQADLAIDHLTGQLLANPL